MSKKKAVIKKYKAVILCFFILLTLPIALLINSKDSKEHKPLAQESRGPLKSCEIDDKKHPETIKAGGKIYLSAVIIGGYGAYRIKWKAENKDLDTSSLDAAGFGTFQDSGIPASKINPAIWYTPNAIRDVQGVKITLTVRDQMTSESVNCQKTYTLSR